MNRAILQNPTEPFEMLCFFVGHESRRMHASENPVLEFMLCKFETYAPPSALQASAAVTTLNRRLYLLLRDAIFNGQIAAGAKLPSSRSVANALKIARNTVVYAYDQLAAEGYVSGNAGSGTFVNDTLADTNPAPADMSEVIRQASSLRPLLSRRGGELIADARALATQSGAFVPGVPDVSQFPHAIWRRLQLGYWRRPNSSLMAYASDGGHLPLRKALCDYLSVARSVRCTPEQILITSGTHQSIDLCGRLLGDVGEHAWIEDPCYWGARNVLQMAGLELHPVPVDEEGLNPQSQHLQHPPRLIYVTPSHQYPLGSIMSLSRRRLLLEYARHHQCWILEDDYDSEFRYNARPLASLQGLDDHDRVIYMGTCIPAFAWGIWFYPCALHELLQLLIQNFIAMVSWCFRPRLVTLLRKAISAHMCGARVCYTESVSVCCNKLLTSVFHLLKLKGWAFLCVAAMLACISCWSCLPTAMMSPSAKKLRGTASLPGRFQLTMLIRKPLLLAWYSDMQAFRKKPFRKHSACWLASSKPIRR